MADFRVPWLTRRPQTVSAGASSGHRGPGSAHRICTIDRPLCARLRGGVRTMRLLCDARSVAAEVDGEDLDDAVRVAACSVGGRGVELVVDSSRAGDLV